MPTKEQLKAKKDAAKAKTANAKSTPKRKPAASTGRSATASATAEKNTGGKRVAAAEQNAKHMATVVKLRGQGKPWSEIAETISTTPGKAQFLMMQHRVAEGEVPTISTNGNSDAVVKRLVTARNKADEFSSWGWLSARSGLTENVIKKMLLDAGEYEPKSSNIAAVRAAANGGGSTKTATPKAKPKAKPAATGSAAAKAKAKARTKKANPSK